jgi:myeloid leukemia factor 1
MIATVVCLLERENKSVNYRSDHNRTEGTKPQIRSSIFQTFKATYGGMYGAYYTSTRTRRTGGDGVSKLFLVMWIF